MKTIDGDDDSYDEINKRLKKIWRNAVGEIHRDGDLPAVIWYNGSMEYFRNDEYHRDGGLPAVNLADGSAIYYKNGRYHRDGRKPAVIWYDGSVEYWFNGKNRKKQK